MPTVPVPLPAAVINVNPPAPVAAPVIKPIPTYTPPVNPTPVPSEKTYTIQRGDTLWGIGQKFHVNWETIYNNNRNIIKNPDLIYAGQKITIP